MLGISKSRMTALTWGFPEHTYRFLSTLRQNGKVAAAAQNFGNQLQGLNLIVDNGI